MHDDVASVDWSGLRHCYGTAEAFPDRLAALAHGSDEDRTAALEWCWDYLIHQGSRTEASVAAIPFLFDVLESPGFSLDQELIRLTLALGVGLGDYFLPRGWNLADEERRLAERSFDGLFLTDIERIAYRVVEQRSASYVAFLSPDRRRATRSVAGFAVASFAQRLAPTRPQVSRLVEEETDEGVLASLTFCLGMLGRHADEKLDVEPLLNRLSPDRSPLSRLSSAIALTTTFGADTPDPAYRTLLQALTEVWSLPPEAGELPWNDGDLLGYAALALQLVGPDRRDEIAGALCAALAAGEGGSFAIPQTLLELLFPGPHPPDGTAVADLDRVQRASLATLLRSGQWRSWMLDGKLLSAGLTGDAYRSALNSLVREVTGDVSACVDLPSRLGNVPDWNQT